MQLKKHSAVNSHETTYKQLVWLSAISALAMEPEDLNIYGQHHWNVKRQTYLLSFTQTLYKVKLSVQSILLNCQAAKLPRQSSYQGQESEDGHREFDLLIGCHKRISGKYRVFAGNLQKRNWKIDTSMRAIGAQNLFSSLYKLGSNFLWIREI